MRKFSSTQLGQTLIETMVAVLILTMGISAAVGLAIYAFGASTNVVKQIVAVGLAREGVEAIKNIRDTNWLQLGSANMNTNCYDFANNQNDANCYQDWLNHGGNWNNSSATRGYNFDPGSGGSVSSLDVVTSPFQKYWNLNSSASNFGLDQNVSIGSGGFTGIYQPHTGSGSGNSGFYRRITLSDDTTAPYFNASSQNGSNHYIGPRLLITVEVWWVDKQCPASPTPPTSGRCYIKLQSSLTNWKDYHIP